MAYRAATEERTGEVREMRTRNDPENAVTCQCVQCMGRRHDVLALANTEIKSNHAASPRGNSNGS